MNEILRWKRGQSQAKKTKIQKLSNSEYLDAFMGMVRPLKESNTVLNTICNYFEADSRFAEPDDDFVIDGERTIMQRLRRLRVDEVPESALPGYTPGWCIDLGFES